MKERQTSSRFQPLDPEESPITLEKLIDAFRVAELLDVHVSTVRRLPRAEIPRVKIGGRIKYRPADVAAYIERHREDASYDVVVPAERPPAPITPAMRKHLPPDLWD